MDAMITAISTAATIALTMLMEWFILSRRKRHSRRSQSTWELLLDYNKVLKGFAVIGVGFYMFLFATTLLYDWRNFVASAVVSILLFAFVGLPAFGLFIETFYVEHVISRFGISKKSPWSKGFFCPWSSIESIMFSASAQCFIIRSKEGRIRLHMYLNGLEDFARAVAENVPPEKWTGAASQINLLRYRAG
jgi:hypothetical protein